MCTSMTLVCGIEVIVPDVFQQHGAGDHLVPVPHEVLEEAEFAGLQVDVLAGPAHVPAQQVDVQVADLHLGDLVAALPQRAGG